jgi:hypothetical protein
MSDSPIYHPADYRINPIVFMLDKNVDKYEDYMPYRGYPKWLFSAQF